MLQLVVGRLHPLLVHLPIGFLILAFAMELFSRREKYAHIKRSISFVLGLTFLSAVVACFTGWILPKEGAYDEALVGRHFWFAVGLTVGTGLLYLLEKEREGKWGRYYFPCFILNMILLTITGHFGGSLTHGSNYLFEEAGAGMVQVKSADELFVYQDVIQPIFKKKCTSCHNPQKIKGGLIMTNQDGLVKGGENGPIYLAGNPDESLLLQRVHLPKVEKEHMPPDGKAQLTNDEINLIEWWIEQGAVYDKKAKDLERPEKIQNILKKYELTTMASSAQNIKHASLGKISDLREAGFLVEKYSEESPFISVGMSFDTSLTKQKLSRLKKVASNVKHLDLSFSNVTSSMLSVLGKLNNLESLELQSTKVDNSGLKNLKDKKFLQSINLYGTEVDDEVFEILRELPALQRVYLWNTPLEEDSIKSFINEKPLVEVNYKVDEDMFGDARLKPPLILAEADIFKDTMRFELNLNFKNVNIHYTLDGTSPDSTSSIYTESILLDKSAVLKAMAFKDGWQGSEIIERVFTQAKYDVANITLAKGPSDRYKAKGAKTLVDFEKGTSAFTDGKWLGYENNHLSAVLDLGKRESISSVTVGALEDTNSYIFYPKGIKVFTSKDGRNFVQSAVESIPTAAEPHPPQVRSYLLQFEEREARYVKVEVESNLVNPKWHAAPGADCWVFIDEIVVN